MGDLRATDVRAVLEFVGETYRSAPCEDFRLDTLARLRSLVPSDMTAWVETRAGKPDVEVVACPHDPLPDGPRRFARVRHAHPVLAHFEKTRHGGAAKLSDFLGRARYHRLPIYQEFFRPAGVEHQISIALPSASTRLVRITLNRSGGDFSERDRLVLDLVRPHVAQAHATTEQVAAFTGAGNGRDDLERVAEALGVGVVTLHRDGRIDHADARARDLLDRYFAGAGHAARLPRPVSDWLASGRRASACADLPLAQRPLYVAAEGGRLELRSLPGPGRRTLLLREKRATISPRALESLGLTPRQAEVLAWLAQGKANLEIAGILGISPNTVARHVEAIFARLGVRTRTNAAAIAFAHLVPT